MTQVNTPEQFPEGCNPRDGRLSLRQLRKLNSHTLRSVEEETGINRGVLSRIERGIMAPGADQLLTLADLYDVNVADFVFVAGWELPANKVDALDQAMTL